jgi:two-component system, OmpR family, phosphate regulon sensor histidine kinase PhoR
MSHLEPLRTPGKLLLLFLLVAGIPFVALTWLGWQLLEQDRALEERRARERLESAASLVCRELDRSLSALEDLLPSLAERDPAPLAADRLFVVFDEAGVVRHRSGLLPFLPGLPSQNEPITGLFAPAERLEYSESNHIRASAIYRELAQREDPRIRAGALMRLARCLRKQQHWKEAITVYGELAALGGMPIAGSPAEYLARRERAVLMRLIGDERAASEESRLLAAALWEGKYPVDQATFGFFRESLPPPPGLNKALAAAEMLKAAWEQWQRTPTQTSGRIARISHGISMVALWRSAPAGRSVIVSGVDPLATPLLGTAAKLHVSLKLEDSGGALAWVASRAEMKAGVAKLPQETGLPWIVRVASSDPAEEMAVSVRRRNLLIGSLVLVLLVIVAASYFVFRAVNRELSVARLQSDFVAAVSHEFRTPLTAMCHLTELLEEGNAREDRLLLYYRALGKESRRLRGMVESLLDFARMEAGRQIYRLEEVDIAGLVEEVVEEFREQISEGDQRVVLEIFEGKHCVQADREAIARALRNLLDNAVKYSPESSPVRVSVKPEDAGIAVAVEDEGPGISKEEQKRVFRKFMRGTASRTLNVKGTGIGLAMVDHIVRGHHGRVRLESAPGRGSRFTLPLPGRLDRP